MKIEYDLWQVLNRLHQLDRYANGSIWSIEGICDPPHNLLKWKEGKNDLKTKIEILVSRNCIGIKYGYGCNVINTITLDKEYYHLTDYGLQVALDTQYELF
jgi:hypothetical protein